MAVRPRQGEKAKSLAFPVGRKKLLHAAWAEEQERDWKDMLRAYKTPDDSEALFVLQERQGQREWNRIEFTFSLRPK